MRKSQKRWALLGSVLGLTLCLGICNFSVLTANAGVELKQPTVDKFDDGRVSDYWVSENAEITLDQGVAPALRLEEAAEGAGLITLDEVIATSTCIELEIASLDFSNGGWLAFMLGTNSTTPILNWTELLNSGKYITLSYHGGYGWMMRTYANVDGVPKAYNLVDQAGQEINLAIQKEGDVSTEDESYYLVDLPRNGGKLENIKLRMYLDDEGNYSFSYTDAAQTTEKVVAKTQTKKYEPYTTGHLGFCVMQGSSRISGKVANLKSYINGQNTPTTEFRFNEENIGSDYLMDGGSSASSIAFVREGKLKLETNGTQTSYAIHKSSATFDPSVIGSVISENISMEETLYFDEFQNGAEFDLNFGLTKASTLLLKTTNTYALRITKEAEKTYFDVVKYTSDDGEYSTAVGKTEVNFASVCTISLTIDGDGKAIVVVGDETKTFTDVEFEKNRIYFANILNGNASVRIDDYRMNNVIYSKPTNKDLVADFTNDDINVKEWYLPWWGGNYEGRYDGVFANNEELMFKNVNTNAGITTMPQYSNFELKFDITDVQRAGVDEGNTSTDIRVMYGIQDYKEYFNILYIVDERPMFTLRPNTNPELTDYSILHIEGERAGTLPAKYNVFSPKAEGTIFNVKLSMTDGLIEACIKLSSETEYYTIFSIQTSGSVTGHIRISGYGDGENGDGACSNFCIDNLSVKNTDKDANNTADYGYKSNSDWIKWVGFEYVDTWKDDELLPVNQESEGSQSGCGSVVSSMSSAGVLLASYGLVALLKKKGGDKDEE